MSNNYNNLTSVPKLEFKGLLSAPKGCLRMYDHESYVQVTGGLILLSKFVFDQQQIPEYISYPLHSTESAILDLVVTSDGKIVILTKDKFGIYELVIYTDGKPSVVRLEVEEAVFMKSYPNDNQICYVFEGGKEEFYSQIIWFESLLKKVKASAVIQDRVKFYTLEDDAKLSILLRNKIEQYRADNKSICFEASYPVEENIIGFVELSDRLVTYSYDKININRDERVVQTIKMPKIIKLIAVTLGFIAFCEGKLFHYQRRGDVFTMMDVVEIDVALAKIEISKKEHLILVQAENGLAIIIELNNNRIDENDNKRSFGNIFSVRSEQQHVSLVSVSTDANPYLIVVRQETSELVVFSKITLQQILVYKIDCAPIYDCQLESNKPYFLLSAAGAIRRFYILYDHIQQTSQINLRARRLVLSPTNAYVACLIGSANYSKVQILSQNELKDVSGLWIGQEILDVVWSDHDIDIYVILENGYERWTILDGFINKKKKEFISSVVISASYSKSKAGVVILMSDMMVHIVKQQQIIATYKQQPAISSVSSNGNILFMPSLKGTLYYNVLGSKYSPMELKLFSGDFTIVNSNGSQVICLSKDKTTLIALKMIDKEIQQKQLKNSLRGEVCDENGKDKEKKSNKLQQKDITFVQRSFIKSIMKKQRNHEQKSLQVYQQMQETVRQIQKRYEQTLNMQKDKFSSQIKDVENCLEQEILNNKNLEREVRENKQKYQNEQLKGIEELEKLYDRKITILTNKLMTENEISLRNTIQSKESIELLHKNHAKDLKKMELLFENKIKQLQKMDISEKQRNDRLIKQYEQRLLQQHEESESLIRSMQFQYQQIVTNQKRIVFQWQEKHKKCVVDKINIEEAIAKLKIQNGEFEKKSRKQAMSIEYEKKRIVYLNEQIEKLSKHIRDLEIQLDRQRANSYQLSQSNQVLGFKILQSREAILPKQKKLEELKEKFCSFETEYQKVLTELSEQSQVVEQARKENAFLKKQISAAKDVQQKEHRNFVNLLYDIREIVTETPTEDWNKKISLLYQDINNRGLFPTETKNARRNKKTMIEEIDRSKNHLELCLKQVIASNNKIQERKSHQLLKKLKENADLLQQINELRTKLKKYELMDPFKQKPTTKLPHRALSFKRQITEEQRVATEVIQQEEQQSLPTAHIHSNQNELTAKKQSRGFQSTSVDFRRSSTVKKGEGRERITRNTMRKAPIQLVKMKRSQAAENEEVQFLYRKVELQEKIIISLRAKINGVNV